MPKLQTMIGRITRLVDTRQVGSISAEDGHDYAFTSAALRDVAFQQLSLGTSVNFTPAGTPKMRRADSVRLVR
jgi:hypothetical protein